MLKKSRAIQVTISSLLVAVCLSTGVSAKTISDSYTGIINISMSTDGYIQANTGKFVGGKVLISYKFGESQADMQYPKYQADTNVKFYNDDGSFKYAKDFKTGDSVFSDDFSDWISPNDVPEVPDSSAYNMDSGEKIIQGNKPKVGENWFMLGSPTSKGYVQVNAVYKYSSGIYSDTVSKTFYYDEDAINSVATPDLKITETSRTDNEVVLLLDFKTKDTSHNLTYLMVYKPDGTVDDITIPDLGSSLSYTIKTNGEYRFKLYASGGGSTEVTWKEDKMPVPDSSTSSQTDNSIDVLNTSAPKLTFDGIPEKQKLGEPFTMTVTADQTCTISSDGVNYTDVTTLSKEISRDGDYTFTAVGKNGKSADFSVTIDCFEKSINSEPIKDAYSFWGAIGDTLGEEVLPQTGGISLSSLCIFGSGVLIVGIKLMLSGRKKSKSEDLESNEVK